MQRYEYKVVPAPRRGEKMRGIKTTEGRFALALTQVMNELGRDGWDYVRTDALPCDERVGLTGSRTSFQHMLVFRRGLDAEAAAEPAAPPAPRLMSVSEGALPPAPPLVWPPAPGFAPQVGAARPGVAAE